MELFSREYGTEFFLHVKELLIREEVQHLRNFPHHRKTSRYDHVLLVSYLSFALAKKLRLDSKASARAGLLHDLFWSECDNSFHLCITHPEAAAENAGKLITLTDRERNIILSHMWPAGRHLPKYREAWLVDLVDTGVTVLDYLKVSKHWNTHLLRLLPSEG